MAAVVSVFPESIASMPEYSIIYRSMLQIGFSLFGSIGLTKTVTEIGLMEIKEELRRRHPNLKITEDVLIRFASDPRYKHMMQTNFKTLLTAATYALVAGGTIGLDTYLLRQIATTELESVRLLLWLGVIISIITKYSAFTSIIDTLTSGSPDPNLAKDYPS